MTNITNNNNLEIEENPVIVEMVLETNLMG